MKPQHKAIRSTLTSFIRVPVEDDRPPQREVPLTHVPIIGIRTVPVVGISMHYGNGDIGEILQRQDEDAQALGAKLYEVRAAVDITTYPLPGESQDKVPRLLPGIKLEHLKDDQELDPDNRLTQVISLTRAKDDADAFLRDLVAAEIEALGDMEMMGQRLSKVVARYPHLLDHLAEHPMLNHVIMFLWEADVPGLHNPITGETVVKSTKIATLYRRERVLSVETVNSDYVKAFIPDEVGQWMEAALDDEASIIGTAKRRSAPGMR